MIKLELSDKTASVLRGFLACVGGKLEGPRAHTDALYVALNAYEGRVRCGRDFFLASDPSRLQKIQAVYLNQIEHLSDPDVVPYARVIK